MKETKKRNHLAKERSVRIMVWLIIITKHVNFVNIVITGYGQHRNKENELISNRPSRKRRLIFYGCKTTQIALY